MATATKKAISRQEVIKQYERLKQTVESWEASNDESLYVNYRGQFVKSISSDVESAMIELMSFLDDENFDRPAWRLVMYLDKFCDAFLQWAEGIRHRPSKTDPSGGFKLWNQFAEIERRGMLEPKFGSVESVKTLAAQKVPWNNIAKIYGWVDENGSPDTGKVQEELAKPGTHTKNWVHPDQIAYDRELDRQWQERLERFKDGRSLDVFSGDDTPNRNLADPGAAPESIAELLQLQGITIEQVARMKGVTVDEVRQVAVELRIPVDESIAAEVANMNTSDQATKHRLATDAESVREDIDRRTRLDLAGLETYAEFDDSRSQVLAMSEDGVPAGKITLALRDQHPGLTYEQVKRFISEGLDNGEQQQRSTKTAASESARGRTDRSDLSGKKPSRSGKDAVDSAGSSVSRKGSKRSRGGGSGRSRDKASQPNE